MSAACFRAYDLRGRIGDELHEDMAWGVGQNRADCLKASHIVVGADAAQTGLRGTEGVCFDPVHLQADGESHAFINEHMRKEDTPCGGTMSGHHYFGGQRLFGIRGNQFPHD